MISDLPINDPRRDNRAWMLMAVAISCIANVAAAETSIPQPVIPDKSFAITEHRAIGDGEKNNAMAIQQTIEAAAAAGGGRVVVPAGRFVSGPITLRNKIDLHLEQGACLLMSPNAADFPVTGNRHESFIRAAKLHDIRISGEGVIDGQGEPWWSAFRATKGTGDDGPRRPQMIYLEKCERVELSGFTTLNPPNTHCSLRDSTDVTIDRLKMIAPEDSANTDALNLAAVRNAIITRCDISTGDDNIVLLGSGNNDPANPKVNNVTIRDCKLGAGHGLSIGSYTSGGIQNVHAENITFDGTTSGIRMKAWRDRGGLVKNITYKNITMKNVRYPIHITSYYPKAPKGPAEDMPAGSNTKTPDWTDIVIEDVTIADSANSILLWGLPDKPITNLTLKNVKASCEQGAVVFHTQTTFSGVSVAPRTGPALRLFNAEVNGMAGVPFEGNFKAK